MRAPSSLKRLLSLWLVVPLVALVLLTALPAYKLAVKAANDAYDDELLDPAIAIARYVRLNEDRLEVDLPPVALEALRVDTANRIFFRVTGPEGELIAGNATIPSPGDPLMSGGHTVYSTRVNDLRVRVAALKVPRRYGPVLVQVAETTDKRDRLVREIFAGALIPAVIVGMTAAGLLWFGIRRALAPLDRLRDELLRRSPTDLAPVPDADSPAEVKPLVSALNQLLSRLDAALGTQQRFIANAAHQLRTPLAGLKTHVELARREQQSGEARALLDMIAGETDRASHLANQLLALARAEPGSSLPVLRQAVNVRTVANRAVQEWVPQALERNIDIGFELEDAWIMGDPSLLRELLANLLHNAILYSGPESTVTVRTRSLGTEVVLEIEDNGPGIPANERERVFERFYRIAGTTEPGCGLGLAIVREIADRHDARVQLETPASGTGTRLRVTFAQLRHPPAG
jgi:two-component system, OmpR family, sensor histidine kinase TctE